MLMNKKICLYKAKARRLNNKMKENKTYFVVNCYYYVSIHIYYHKKEKKT